MSIMLIPINTKQWINVHHIIQIFYNDRWDVYTIELSSGEHIELEPLIAQNIFAAFEAMKKSELYSNTQ